MKSLLIFAVAIKYLLFTANCTTLNGGGTINLINLGTIDGKSFFAENTTRTWSQARQFCIDHGMKLAKIENNGQVGFLHSKKNATTFSGAFWIAGREAGDSRVLSWDDTDTMPASLNVTWVKNYGGYVICSYFTTSVTSNLYLHLCSNTIQTLCET